MGKNLNNENIKHFSDLEVEKLDSKYTKFVQKSSLTILLSIIALFIISPAFFDRLQYEDGYVENLTVAFLLIAITGIGKYLIKLGGRLKRMIGNPYSLYCN